MLLRTFPMMFRLSHNAFRFLLVTAFVGLAVPAGGQTTSSTYVGGSLIGEFGRFGGVDVDGDDDDDDIGSIPELAGASADTTTIGFGINVGRTIGQRWGVEFAFGRGGTSEKERRAAVLPAFIDLTRFLPPPGFVLPDFAIETSQQHTTFDALLWLRNELGTRVDLMFLGGVSFNLVEIEQEISISDPRANVFFTIPRETEAVEYGVGPVVGAEAVVDIAEHVAVTGGLRIHGVDVRSLRGWLIRPSVGLRWTF